MRRRRVRVGLTTLSVFVGESAFGFASDVAVAFRVRGSMFSLFKTSQLAYARCCWGLALVRFRPGLPAFCGAHLPAASGPMSTFVAPCAGIRCWQIRPARPALSARSATFKPSPYRTCESMEDARTALGSATPGRGLRPAQCGRSAAVARSSVRRGTGAASSPGQKRRRQVIKTQHRITRSREKTAAPRRRTGSPRAAAASPRAPDASRSARAARRRRSTTTAAGPAPPAPT